VKSTQYNNPSQTLSENKQKKPLLNFFYEASVTLIPKSARYHKETIDPYFSSGKRQKVSTKYYQTEFSNLKKNVYYDQVGLMPGMQG
jgi:hypothetical protein